MKQSIFADLCDIADTLATYQYDFPPGPQRDKFAALAQQLDGVIERTIGVKELRMAGGPDQP